MFKGSFKGDLSLRGLYKGPLIRGSRVTKGFIGFREGSGFRL